MKVYNYEIFSGSIKNITYKDYTSSSTSTGFPDTSNDVDSLINIIKNNTYIHQIEFSEKDNKDSEKD